MNNIKTSYPAGIRNTVLLWLAWVLIVIGFQALAAARLQPQWPDFFQLPLQDDKDPAKYQDGRPYLLEPFMNNQVAWDSEPYIGISIGGYDDHCISVAYRSTPGIAVRCTDTIDRAGEEPIRLSYAFFPFYPLVMHIFAIPLSLLTLNAIATATLAGVVVSALGTLVAMLALYDLTYETLGEDGAMRAVFYLLIFPTSFFFVQVYTEGLFVGLAFGCLAMLQRKKLLYAALFAAAATLTRAVGVALVIPMAISWIRTHEWYDLDLEWDQLYFNRPPWRPIWHALLAFTPLIVYVIWKFSYYGAEFGYVETIFFGRAPLDIAKGFTYWVTTFYDMVTGHELGRINSLVPASFRADYFIEFFCMAVGSIGILRCLKTYPEAAWFSLAAFLIPLVSGPPGIDRYLLAAPAMFISLARWGKNPVFDRAWTLASLLMMGLLAMLFAFNFWVA
jgi:Mannosyltransferase (PIG-V)